MVKISLVTKQHGMVNEFMLREAQNFNLMQQLINQENGMAM